MKYPVKSVSILAIPSSLRRINETEVVHPAVQKHLKTANYEVHHERLAFRVPHYTQHVGLRVDFLALGEDEILIVECKGCPFSTNRILGTLLQLSLYMRVYRMTQHVHNPQLALFEDFNKKLIREGKIRGVIAIPYFDAERELREAAEYLASVDLAETNIEVWNLTSSIYAIPAKRV